VSAQHRPQPQRPIDPIITELRDRRMKEDLSQADLGARFGVKQRALAAWEVGANMPDFATVRRWAAALGVNLTLDQLTDGSPAVAYRRGWDDCAEAARAATEWSEK
jgi:transcriptional regulator with XRE-family HTH domain